MGEPCLGTSQSQGIPCTTGNYDPRCFRISAGSPHPPPLPLPKGGLCQGCFFHQGTSKFLGLEECAAYFLSCSFPSRNNPNNSNKKKYLQGGNLSSTRGIFSGPMAEPKSRRKGPAGPPCSSWGLRTPLVLTMGQNRRDAGQECRWQL